MISQISLQLTEWEDDLVLLSEPNLQQLSTAVDGGLESQTIKGLLPNYDEITERWFDGDTSTNLKNVNFMWISRSILIGV